MSSKIEQIIEEIEEFIDGCKYKALSNTHIIVDKDQIDELLHELKSKTPEEIKRYQKIISNKEAILADAREKANALINEACKDQNALGLVKYIAEEDREEMLLKHQQVIKTPIVRNGKQATVGYAPDVWKKWS